MDDLITGFNRRLFLKGAGISLALPWMASLADKKSDHKAPAKMVIIAQAFGVYAKDFYPESSGRNYTLSESMSVLAPIKNDFTFFKNLDLSVKGGHGGADHILRDIKPEFSKVHPDQGISVDARAAEHFAGETRYPMLSLGTHPGSISWSRSGSPIPRVKTPGELFDMLYTEDSVQAKKKKSENLVRRQSIIDAARVSAKALKTKLSKDDRDKFEEYLNSVREAERKLQEEKKWLEIPKPKGDKNILKEVSGISDNNKDVVKSYEAFIKLIPLILETDATRIITLTVHTSGGIMWEVPGVSTIYHTLTHHGNLPERISQLKLIDKFHMTQYLNLVTDLKKRTLLDSTQVLWCSGLGDSARHSNNNLPFILAGGDFKHGQCIDVQSKQPVSNLYNSMLQKLGVKTEHFNISTGTIKGLDA